MEKTVQCTPTDQIAIPLILELNKKLNSITGDSGTSSFNADDFNPERDAFIVIKKDNEAVACGSIRYFDDKTCEMKRVYSKKKGFGSRVVKQLEEYAIKLGYKKIILSTRKVNRSAVNFYIKCAYKEIKPYGKYRYTDLSICLGKSI